MADGFSIRIATADDAAAIAHHRVSMFTDMGVLAPEWAPRLAEMTCAFVSAAIPAGEYVGWLAHPADDRARIVAGAGAQVRRVLPFPFRGPGSPAGGGVGQGRQAIVLNVYTEPAFRRRGLARLLMNETIAWARGSGIETLVLHAAPDGKPLYESLGFVPTTEMRFTGTLIESADRAR
jgi:GNAT superfamily N-acetyltransferase